MGRRGKGYGSEDNLIRYREQFLDALDDAVCRSTGINSALQWLYPGHLSEEPKAAATWTGPYYQYANRIAALYFLNEVALIPARLLFIYFIGDSFPDGRYCPKTEGDWKPLIDRCHRVLGIPAAHPLSTRIVDVFLPICPTSNPQQPRAAKRPTIEECSRLKRCASSALDSAPFAPSRVTIRCADSLRSPLTALIAARNCSRDIMDGQRSPSVALM